METAAPISIGQQSLWQECSCRFLRVGKSLPQVFEICRRIRTKIILKRSSDKNLGKNSNREKNAPSAEPVRCIHAGHAQLNIPDLIDGFITWQSTLPCRSNQETPFVDEQDFQNRGVCGQAFPFPLPLPLLVIFCARPNFRALKKRKMLQTWRKALRKRLLRRLRFNKFVNDLSLKK